jgi:hypothetical protein
LLDFAEGDFAPSHSNQDIAASKTCLRRAKQLPQHALHPIAIDRAREDAFRNDETESGNAERIGAEEHAESGTPERSPAGKQRGDIGGPEA